MPRRDLAVVDGVRISGFGGWQDRRCLQALEEGSMERTEVFLSGLTQPSSYILDRLAVGRSSPWNVVKKKKPSISLNLIEGDFESSVGNVIRF